MGAPRPSHQPLSSQAAGGPQGPTVLRILLGTQLRHLRELSGVTADAAGYAIRASHAKISRMEHGRVGFKERDVAELLTLYGITDQEQRGNLLALAQRANAPDWWQQYSDILPSRFESYLGLEQASSVIRTYQPQLVPGLLQTRELAQAVLRFCHSSESADDIERRVALLMTRQEVLTHPTAPQLWAVIDQAALWRLEPREVLRDQIQHLLTMAESPHIKLQLLPRYSREYVAVGSPFTILRFTEPDLPDIVCLEQLTGALYVDKAEDVQRYRMAMDRVCILAKSPAETVKCLRAMLENPDCHQAEV